MNLFIIFLIKCLFFNVNVQLHKGSCRFCVWGNVVGLTRDGINPLRHVGVYSGFRATCGRHMIRP